METGAAEPPTSPDSLAERIADGDLSAPRAMVEKHRAELYRYALAMLRDRQNAEDAVQTAFEKALVALGGYPAERIRTLALRPWLYRITLNVTRGLVRTSSREVPVAQVPEESSVLSPAYSMADHREAWLEVLDALGRLPERQRTAVALRYLADLPYAEIAEAAGWPEGTAKTLTKRGVERLRNMLVEDFREDA